MVKVQRLFAKTNLKIPVYQTKQYLHNRNRPILCFGYFYALFRLAGAPAVWRRAVYITFSFSNRPLSPVGCGQEEELIMEFFNSAVEVLQTLVIALGAGLGIWGAINLLEGYGNDNPGANAHVR